MGSPLTGGKTSQDGRGASETWRRAQQLVCVRQNRERLAQMFNTITMHSPVWDACLPGRARTECQSWGFRGQTWGGNWDWLHRDSLNGEGCGYNQGYMQKKRGPVGETRYHYWGLCWEGAGSLQKLLSFLHALRKQDRSSQGEREPPLPQWVPEVGASHPHHRENQEQVPITAPCHTTRKHA